MEEGIRVVELGTIEGEGEGMIGSATDREGGEGSSTKEGVSIGGGTTGIGHDVERKKGISEEVKLGAKGEMFDLIDGVAKKEDLD